MASNIDRDVSRAREILRGKVRKDLKKYINSGELIGRKGKDLVSIPIPAIDRPRFRFGANQRGAAQGEGEKGDIVGGDEENGNSGEGGAGDQPGKHIIEEFSLEELAKMLGEELELPDLQMKGRKQLLSEGYRYSGSHPIGPESLRIRRRTLKRAIIRSVMEIDPPESIFNPAFNPADYIYITPPDKRYRIPKPFFKEEAMAVIFYVLDISGSMTYDIKIIVRQMCLWIELWIDSDPRYRGVEKRYIVHDTSAWEVDGDQFYRTQEGGGTKISSAYDLISMILDPSKGYQSPYGGSYLPEDWNIYIFQFTDGDNWKDDNITCLKIAHKDILPHVNLLGYTQVKGPYGSGDFIETIKRLANSHPNVTSTTVSSLDDIYGGIHELLGKSEKKEAG